jgi:DNA-binding helix-hairpin-helix protein with protein kinase domain
MPKIVLQNPPSGVPPEVEVTEEVKIGGEGAVYFSTDGRFAVKVYHQPHPDKEKLLQYVMKLFSTLPPEQERFLLRPLALVETLDGHKRVGFIMRRVPPEYRELMAYVLNARCAAEQFQQGKTWARYLKVARSIANAIVVLHGKGCAHSDIHFRNFLVNLDEGEAVMLEIDGVVVAGFLPPQVAGMMGFMAPEILTRGERPNERTDRHSLAVLILHTLLFRNVMQPLIEYDPDPNKSEELGWGEHALFSEHPHDHRHRPRNVGLPLYRRGALSYRMLTPALQRLTERALIEGLRDPEKRPSAREWEEALACAYDELWGCGHCGQHFPYPYWLHPPQRRTCPFCGERCRPPLPIVLELYEERQRSSFFPIGRRIVLGHGFKIFSDMIEPARKPPLTRRSERVVGHVEWDGRQGRYRVVNDEGGEWTARSPDLTRRFSARKGESVPLGPGFMIRFGDGKRLAHVCEDRG